MHVATPWSTVWEIAGKRYLTKQGDGSMTESAYKVLQAFAMREQQEAMQSVMGVRHGDF